MPQFITNPQLSGNAGSAEDPFRRKIVEALNAAGIPTHGARDDQLLSAYNALICRPIEEKLAAVNWRISVSEATARAAKLRTPLR